MRKLIYFNDNELVKNFCGDNSELVSRYFFNAQPDRFKSDIAVCYGLSNHDEVATCKSNNIDYIYIDNCYFGIVNSYYTQKKEKCIKMFYRTVANEMVLYKERARDDLRLKKQLQELKDEAGINNYVERWKRGGENIIIVPPTGKILKICNIDPVVWKDELILELKKHTDRNIIIRERARDRHTRFVAEPIHNLFKDAYATITFSSMAAVESLIFGVPNFLYNEHLDYFHSAAELLSQVNISEINERKFPRDRQRYKWLSNLAYGQYSRIEMVNGFAKQALLLEIEESK